MTSAVAVRQQRFRQRRARGVCVLQVDAEEMLVLGALIASGYLAESEAENPASVSAAVTRVVHEWAMCWVDAEK